MMREQLKAIREEAIKQIQDSGNLDKLNDVRVAFLGIKGRMVEYIKEKYKNFMYLELMPEDKNNVPFYEKHGFHVMENGAAMQICNIN